MSRHNICDRIALAFAVLLYSVDQCYAQLDALNGMGQQQQTQVVTNADGTTTTTVVESSSGSGYDLPFNLPMLYACVLVSVIGTYVLICCCCGCSQLCNCSPDKKTVTTTKTTTIDKLNAQSNVYSVYDMQSNATMMTQAEPERRIHSGSNDRSNVDQYDDYDYDYGNNAQHDGQYDQFGNPMNNGGYDQYGNPLNGYDQYGNPVNGFAGPAYGQYPYSGSFDNSSLAAGGYVQPMMPLDTSGASMYSGSAALPAPDENGKIVISDADIIVL